MRGPASAALLALAIAAAAGAPPELAPPFRDHAVLQCDRPVPVWGRAAPGEHVCVSFAGQTIGATADPDGRWIAVLAPLGASPGGSDLTVAGRETVTVHDVLVGEVWLCSGEGNMEFEVDDGGFTYRVRDAASEVSGARYPLIRQFKVARQSAPGPMDAVGGDWTACSPATVGRFTAVGYFFARDLFARLGVPVGIIDCTWSGTPIEAWMSPAALAGLPGASVGPRAGTAPGTASWAPSCLFNGMVHPILPYALRGVAWYQGESDVGRAAAYSAQFPALITSWRSHFGEADMPFLWVQLSGGAAPGADEAWARLREAQSGALSLAGTGQAVSVDIGEPGNLYPRNKQEVARRLALIAKARVYSIPVEDSGPVYSGATAEGASMRVRFKFADDGLTASGRPLQTFQLAGADHVFHPASAAIVDDTVVVRSPAVAQPVAVRFGWSNATEANLYGGNGLPAAPFRSDGW